MIVLAIIRFATRVGDWFVGALPSLPTVTFPASLTFSMPLFGLDSVTISGMNVWLPIALAVALVLAVGRILLFVYRLIPFNG